MEVQIKENKIYAPLKEKWLVFKQLLEPRQQERGAPDNGKVLRLRIHRQGIRRTGQILGRPPGTFQD